MESFDVPAQILGRRDVVVVEGPDALTYLQSQLSQDVRQLDVGQRCWTLVLDPTGKIVALARVTRSDAERFELDIDEGFGATLLARLDRFKIRVKASTSLLEADGGVERDDVARIEFGWPAMGREIIPGETIAAATGLARVAVSFTKGCYPGQELVERMDSRAAEAPRTLRRIDVAEATQPGAPVLLADAAVGVVTSVAGPRALAWIKRGVDVGDPVDF
jgi:folate-binding protein YgfZ